MLQHVATQRAVQAAALHRSTLQRRAPVAALAQRRKLRRVVMQESLIAIKAPSDAVLEVPDPDEVQVQRARARFGCLCLRVCA
jgi:hypothetical protein